MLRKLSAIVVLSVSAWAPLAGTTLADVPDVVVSIKPIHSLAAGVMKGIGEPTLIIKGGASPHNYSLRPSEAYALQNADVVFWVGKELETFLAKPLQAVPEHAAVVALHEANGVTLLSFRERAEWEDHADDHTAHSEDYGDADHHGDDHPGDDHTEHHHGEHTDGHAYGGMDMHIWLDPDNASAIVTQIVATLSEIDTANAPQYQSNGTALNDRLEELDSAIDHDLAPIKASPYIVFHDGYQYFEKHYGLSPAGSITVGPDRKPGARRIKEIRQKIEETGALCVFSEPQFEPAIVNTVIEGTNTKTAILDPLGADLAPSPDAYFQLMRALAVAMKNCLGLSR